ncbi:hypothetical protein Tco_1148447, partial [Tanacetum coccineum]
MADEHVTSSDDVVINDNDVVGVEVQKTGSNFEAASTSDLNMDGTQVSGESYNQAKHKVYDLSTIDEPIKNGTEEGNIRTCSKPVGTTASNTSFVSINITDSPS